MLGIRHPLALPPSRRPAPAGAYSLRGHSIGGFGSVTTNKLLATLIGELFGLYVQAYPRYGSEKKGLPTTYYLTIADEPIREPRRARPRRHGAAPRRLRRSARATRWPGLVDGGTLFIQSPLTDPEAIWATIPAEARAEIIARRIPVVGARHGGLARAHAPRPDLSPHAGRRPGRRLPPGGALRGAAGLGRDELLTAVRARLGRFFGKRGGAVVDANLALIVEAAYDGLIDVTAAIGR